MKKMLAGLVICVGVSLVVYAACTDTLINSSSDDAGTSSCTNSISNPNGSQCYYTYMSPAKPECSSATNTTGNFCFTGTNIIQIVSQYMSGTCNGSGTCHLGTPAAGNPPITNNVNNIELKVCGGS